MLSVPFSQIDLGLLRDLPVSGRDEDGRIDYKADFTRNSKQAIEGHEFRKDVIAFANALGGDLIYGVADKSGKPVAVVGFECADSGGLKEQLYGLIREIDPPLPAIQIEAFTLEEGRILLVVRVGPSWRAPHRVNNSGQFYKRNGVRSAPMNIDEIRAAFLVSEGIETQLQAFRKERIQEIAQGRALVPLEYGLTVILHVMPLAGVSRPAVLDIRRLYGEIGKVPPPGREGGRSRLNFDGVVVYSETRRGEASAYMQWFRRGFLEFVNVYMDKPLHDDPTELYLPAPDYESHGVEGLRRAQQVYQAHLVPPPYFVGVSICNAAGHRIARRFDDGGYRQHGAPLEQNELVVPEVAVLSPDVDALQVLLPVFDQIWNAWGIMESPFYDEERKALAGRSQP